MVSFRGRKKPGPRPHWSPSGVLFKKFDKHMHMQSPPSPGFAVFKFKMQTN